MPEELYFRVLGPVAVERDGRPVRLGGPQARGVLAALVLRAGQVVPVDELIALLWGDAPPASARVQVQGLVSGLRRAMATGSTADPIVTQAPGYRLDAAAGRIDLGQFCEELRAGRAHLAEGEHRRAAELLRTALSRWRGPACADLPYDPIRKAAIGLDELRATAVECRIDADIGLGAGSDLIFELTVLTGRHPLRERFRAQLMTVLARAGRAGDALAVYRDTRAAMVEELGVEPSAELQELHRAVLAGEAGHPRPAAGPVPRQLPAGSPIMVGRANLIDLALATLRSEQVRCIALTGPGGVGKTAIALWLAQKAEPDYPGGHLYARLGGVPPELVLSRFLRALGVPAEEVPRDVEERAALYRTMVASRRVLIVLDDAGGEAALRPLIPATSRSALIVTSRRRLDGVEQLRPIPVGLLPPEEGLELLAAVVGAARVGSDPEAAADLVRHCGGLPLALRIAAARLASRPNWTVRHLADRLADARDRLDWLQLGDLDVRAGIAETYSGLSEDHQRLFRLLSLLDPQPFPGWIPAALLGRPGAERLVEDLAEVHLVEPAGSGVAGPRYRMHDLVRLVARELALNSDPHRARRDAARRAAHGWLALAVAADSRLPHWVGLDPEPEPRWHPPGPVLEAVREDPWTWFDEEWDALAGVVRAAATEGPAEAAWPLAQRLSTYLEMRGRNDEWADVLAWGLEAAERDDDRQGRATMLGLLMHAAANHDDYAASLRYAERTLAAYQALGEAGEPRAEEPAEPAPVTTPDLAAREKALAAARQCEDALGVAFAAARLITALRIAGRNGRYPGLFETARENFRAGGAPVLEVWASKYLGLIYCRRRRFAEAAECLARARDVLKDFDEEAAAAFAGRDLAGFAAAYGRVEAEQMAVEALEHATAVGDRWSIGRSLTTLGEVARARDDRETALRRLRDALAVWRDLNVPAKTEQVSRLIDDLLADS